MPAQRRSSSSGFVGVKLAGTDGETCWWAAVTKAGGKKLSIGCLYASREAAARAYDRAVIAILGHGVNAGRSLGYNFPMETYPEKVRDIMLRLLKASATSQCLMGAARLSI